MCRLLETVKIVNHQPVNLNFHQRSVVKSRTGLFHAQDDFDENRYPCKKYCMLGF